MCWGFDIISVQLMMSMLRLIALDDDGLAR